MKAFESRLIHREKSLCGGAANPARDLPPVCVMALAALVLGLAGCGETAKLPTAASTGQVQTYYGDNQVTIDHYGKQFSVEGTNNPEIEGTFTTTASGFINITETAGETTSTATTIAEENPPLTGAWLAEFTGVAAAGNLLYSLDGTIWGSQIEIMAANTECPSFSKATRFLFVTGAETSTSTNSSVFYGTTDITTQGSSVDFNTNYYTAGQPLTSTPTTYLGDAACASTAVGSVIFYPVNQVEGGSAGDSVIAKSQFLYGYIPAPPHSGGFDYGIENTVGLAMPSSAVSTTALSSTHLIGLLYNPSAKPSGYSSYVYDPSVLAGAFGDEASSSSACSSFQAGITASVANKTLSKAPSAQAIYGGDFPETSTNTTGGPGAAGTETCDMAIDLGTQDATNNGLFPSAQLYTGTSTAVTSATGAAIVSQIDGRSVILVRTSGRLLVLFQALQ